MCAQHFVKWASFKWYNLLFYMLHLRWLLCSSLSKAEVDCCILQVCCLPHLWSFLVGARFLCVIFSYYGCFLCNKLIWNDLLIFFSSIMYTRILLFWGNKMDKTDNNAVTNQPENNNPFSNTIASCDGGQTLRVAACWDRRIGNICIWPCLWRWSKYGGNDWRYIGGRCIICGEEGIEITAVVEKQWPKVLMMVAVMVWRALRRLSHSTAIGWWAHLERIWDERDLLSALNMALGLGLGLMSPRSLIVLDCNVKSTIMAQAGLDFKVCSFN